MRKRTVIPANCSALVRVRVPYERVLRAEGAVVGEISSRRLPVAGADAMVKMSRKGTTKVRVDNLLDVDLILQRGLRVGRVEAINLEECQEIDMTDLPREKEPTGTKCDPEKKRC